jgi:hypothetical protein
MKLTDLEVMWLACAVDFEGSILMYPSTSPGANNVRANTTILTNTNYQLIERACNLLEKEGIQFRNVPLSKGKRWQPQWKHAWRVEISPVDDNKYFLKMIRPYLVSKYEQCDLVLEYLSRRTSNTKVKTTEYEWGLMHRCQELNKRGISESVETICRGAKEAQDIVRTAQRCAELTRNGLTLGEVEKYEVADKLFNGGYVTR